MYFTLRNQRMYAWAMRLRGTHRYLLTGIGLTLLWCLWGYGIYYANNALIDQYHRDIAVLRTQANQARDIAQQCDLDEKCVEELKDFMSPYCMGACDKEMVQSRMIEIIKSVKQAELRLMRCNIHQCVDKDWYVKHTIRVDGEGSLVSIQRFFSHLKETPKMIQCAHARIDRKNNDTFHLSTDLYVISLKNKIPST